MRRICVLCHCGLDYGRLDWIGLNWIRLIRFNSTVPFISYFVFFHSPPFFLWILSIDLPLRLSHMLNHPSSNISQMPCSIPMPTAEAWGWSAEPRPCKMWSAVMTQRRKGEDKTWDRGGWKQKQKQINNLKKREKIERKNYSLYWLIDSLSYLFIYFCKLSRGK